ncbi:MAG: molybdopterin-dependent oxidoreductase [Planctomycetota bacterium]|jgi:2-dehydropantoate 2-reductase
MSRRKAPLNPHGILTIEGECERPASFSHLDLAEIHPYYQVEDLSLVDERLFGTGVRLRRLIDLIGPECGTEWMTIHSADGGFSACLPLEEIRRTGIVVYQKGGRPLSIEDGGPARFVIPYYPDKCANVKAIGRIEISRKPGKDTRPSTAGEHDALHAAERKA